MTAGAPGNSSSITWYWSAAPMLMLYITPIIYIELDRLDQRVPLVLLASHWQSFAKLGIDGFLSGVPRTRTQTMHPRIEIQNGLKHMSTLRLVGILCALAIAGAAIAQPSAPPAKPTAEEIVAARQAALDMSVMTFSSMQIAARDGTDVGKQVYPATALNKWAKALRTLFPAGTGIGSISIPTHAKPEIWSDRAGFEKAAAEYVAATAKAIEFAQAGDSASFKMQIGEIKRSCDNCHETYKTKYMGN